MWAWATPTSTLWSSIVTQWRAFKNMCMNFHATLWPSILHDLAHILPINHPFNSSKLSTSRYTKHELHVGIDLLLRNDLMMVIIDLGQVVTLWRIGKGRVVTLAEVYVYPALIPNQTCNCIEIKINMYVQRDKYIYNKHSYTLNPILILIV